MRYFAPNFLGEALELLDRYGDGARVLAGGTVLGPLLRENGSPIGRLKSTAPVDDAKPAALVNIKRIDELSHIKQDGAVLRIGALTTARRLSDDGLLLKAAPLLAQAAATLGARQLRNVATIGGNVCYGHPAADLAAALLALDARCEIASARDGVFDMPIDRFFRPHANALRSSELLLGFAIPVGDKSARTAYHKMLTRRAFEMALVSVAVALDFHDRVVSRARIALGGAADRPIRATAAEAVLAGQAPDSEVARSVANVAAEADADPEDDFRSSADYRRHLVRVLLERALADAASAARGDSR